MIKTHHMPNKLIEVSRRFKETEPEREERIQNEIIVDAYDNDEVASSWYYYLDEMLHFPFTAMVHTHRSGNTSYASQVEIKEMAEMSRCGYGQMWVRGALSLQKNTPLHFFLSDITSVEEDEERVMALEDWNYWCRNQLS